MSTATTITESRATAKAPTVLRIDGQLINDNRQEFKQRILDLIETGARQFVIDLGACGYVDSAGLDVLVSCHKKARDAGGEIVLADLNEDVKILFALTKMDTLFVVADTPERAIAHLEGRT